jgi:hypothetical protein
MFGRVCAIACRLATMDFLARNDVTLFANRRTKENRDAHNQQDAGGSSAHDWRNHTAITNKREPLLPQSIVI